MFINLDLMLRGDNYDIEKILDVEECVTYLHIKDIREISISKEKNKYVVKVKLIDRFVIDCIFEDLEDAEEAVTSLAKIINDNI